MNRIGEIVYQLSEEEHSRVKSIVSSIDSYVNDKDEYSKDDAEIGIKELMELFEVIR